MVIFFSITRSGKVQKSPKKKKKILREVFSRGFPICGNKKGGKISGFLLR